MSMGYSHIAYVLTGKEEVVMATWQCVQCGYEKEARCKPRKCPQCEGKDSFSKKDSAGPDNEKCKA